MIPTNVVAVPKNQSAIVSFTPNGNNATSFLVTSNPNGFSANGTSSPITVTGLTNGVSYTFIVKAIGNAGTSGNTAPSNPVTPIPIPLVPTNIVVTPGNNYASVSFIPSAYATSYTVNTGEMSVIGTSSPILITGLSNGTSYSFTLNATNSSGTSDRSQGISVLINPIPSAPTNLVATLFNGSITLSFTPSNYATGYQVTAQGVNVIGTKSPIIVSGLQGEVTLVLKAYNLSGYSPGAQITTTI
jgi:hypothetical protein